MIVDKSAERVREMFGQIARRYDLLNHLLSLGIDRSWRRRTTRLVPPRGEAPILDVCTGTGDLALAYWRAGGGRARIVGADFCRPMLQIGRQ
jgi:demethylmenaquinone methyltransferase/2-methoxy-6-polyprenyl-1,4-benzoquinol methylase